MENSIEIITGYKCNNGCIFCSADENFSSVNMDTDGIKRLIALGKKKYGQESLAFSGGEPTIRKDLSELVRFARKSGFRHIKVKSNGYMFCYQNRVKDLVEAGVDAFHVTFHGFDPEIYEKTTRVKGSSDYVLKGIANILNLKKRVIIDHTVSRLNHGIVKGSVEKLERMGIKDFYLWLILPEGKAAKKGKDISLSMSEAKKTYEKLFKYADKKKIFLKSLFTPYCIFPEEKNRIFNPKEEGIVMLTPQSEFSLENSVLDFGDKPASCRGCLEYEKCFGIHPGYLKLWGSKEFAPVK